ncbi:MAG: mechanosensitive ion channel family protein [Pontibacterium sp.]
MTLAFVAVIAFTSLSSLSAHAVEEGSATAAVTETSVNPAQSAATPSPEGEGNMSNAVLDVAEAFAIDDDLKALTDQYDAFLANIGLSDNVFGALVATLAFVVAFLVARLFIAFSLRSLKKWVLGFKHRLQLSEGRIDFYYSALTLVSSLILFCLMLVSVLNVWDVDLSFLSSDSIQNITAGLVSILFIIALGIVAVEVASGLINIYFDKQPLSESRISTLKPIAKNTILALIFFTFGMAALSQLGIDILPLLAGAGVLGIAIGFGAQSLVSDIITGFIIILEDLIQVGDVVTLNDRTGAIERITVRKVQMRAFDGTVFTIPFGQISIVENHTKLFSYYVFEVGVAYREDVNEVMALLKDLGKALRADDEFSDAIMDDLEVFGVDQLADSAVVIKARIKTKAKQQWSVGREFNRRMKMAFDEHNIEIPFPHQTIYMGEPKLGKAPALNVDVSGTPTTKVEAKPTNIQ